jgi:type IV secretion system protein VirB9
MKSFLSKRVVAAAIFTVFMAGGGIFLRIGARYAAGATADSVEPPFELAEPFSYDDLQPESGMVFGDNPIEEAQQNDSPEVIEVDDPESVIFEQKMQAVEKVPSLRSIDDTAVKLALAYDEATGAPKPYIQENGRINFYFGTMNPRVVCKPLRLTDIELEPGETVRNVHISDSVRWAVSGASSGPESGMTTHVILKPQLPDIAANMLIHTDRRTYSVELISVAEGQFMPFVGFVYPETPISTKAADAESWRALLTQYKRADDVRASASTQPVQSQSARVVDASDVYTGYTIKVVAGKNIPWEPRSVYDSRGKTYISMPDKMQVTEAPVMSVKRNGREQLVNYRVEGNVYIVDRLFDIGILTIGKDRVAIYRNTPVAVSDEEPAVSK